MKIFKRENQFSLPDYLIGARVLVVAGFLLSALPGQSQPSFGGSSGPTYTPLETWTFRDNTNWTSDHGQAPASFTNLDYSYLGDGSSLVVNSTNPAWLNFNAVETSGATNFNVDAGTLMFWFAPSSWSSTNAGGNGPGQYSRLFEVGSYTSDSSLGWWSIYVDSGGNNLYFSTQTNDLSSSFTTYVSAPISWTTNYFHHVALTYSATNTALYLDGSLATNGPPLTVFPGANVLAKGLFIGSDSNGLNQAGGMFNSVATYNVPLDAGTIGSIHSQQYEFYMLSPWNMAMFSYSSVGGSSTVLSQPSSSPSAFNIISGTGNLSWLGYNNNCITSSNVWITNMTVNATSQPLTFNFSIAGGVPGAMYDVFVTTALKSPLTNSTWIWLGQGPTCSSYSIPNLTTTGNLFFILGTARDTDGDGLTDAYELLVSHSNPNVVDTDGLGMPDGWQVLHFGVIKNNPNADPDRDGLYNGPEYLYGTDPNVNNGFGVWVNSVN